MTISSTQLPLPMLRRGKVRDVYEVDDRRLLLVATDRVSAFDVVMGEPVPYKGAVLTQLTAWWLRQLDGTVDHHLLSADADEIIREIPRLAEERETLVGRAMLCRRTTVFPVECVIRGYISGSAWKEYVQSGTLAGDPMPRGLRESDRLNAPLFSPATKAETGHDQNITPEAAARLLGESVATDLERLSRVVYGFGCRIAEPRGIIIADTKFEFGSDGERILLIDEVLTPDSSRFWPAASYEPGRGQASFDKQPLRDYLDGQRAVGRWNGEAPAPPLPREVVESTSKRYLDAYARITGTALDLEGIA